MLLEPGPEIVEPVQPIRVESAGSAAFIVQQGRLPAGGPASRFVPNGGVGGVKADDIYPQAGETGGQLVGGFMVRGVGAGGQVEPNKPGPCAVREIEVAVLYGDVAVLARRGVQQVGEIQSSHVGGGFVFRVKVQALSLAEGFQVGDAVGLMLGGQGFPLPPLQLLRLNPLPALGQDGLLLPV